MLAAATAQGGEPTGPAVATASAKPPNLAAILADAGPAQSAEVGDRVTLDGSRGQSSARVSYRWIAAGGPPVRLSLEDRHLLTWVPESPGVYRFALVVAADGVISEPDYIEITVTEPPKKTVPDPRTVAITSEALRSLNAPASTAAALGEIAERIAARVGLYDSYNVLLHELSRSLDPLISPDAAARSSWNETLFVPLSTLLVERLRAESLDLSRPGALDARLSDSQRAALAAFFREVSAGSRAYRDGVR